MSAELAEAVKPFAARLVRAVENERPKEIAEVLHGLDRQHLYALAVVLAAHVDLPIADAHRAPDDMDDAVVLRLLHGDSSLAKEATRAERLEVVRQWRRLGRSSNELERITGWHIQRYAKELEAA